MKDFEEFKAYMRENGDKVHEEICDAVEAAVEKESFEDSFEKLNYQRIVFSELSAMKVLEAYHKWLNL